MCAIATGSDHHPVETLVCDVLYKLLLYLGKTGIFDHVHRDYIRHAAGAVKQCFEIYHLADRFSARTRKNTDPRFFSADVPFWR